MTSVFKVRHLNSGDLNNLSKIIQVAEDTHLNLFYSEVPTFIFFFIFQFIFN